MRWIPPSLASAIPPVLCLALSSACADGATTPPPAAGNAPAAGGAAAPSGVIPALGANFIELISTDWELAPGTEQYLCVRKTAAETMFLGGSRSESPLGTHHVVLTVSEQPDGEPDGVSPCDVATIGTRNLFGAGVGGVPRLLPPGIAMKIEKGSQLLLNVHLFNFSEQPIRGRAGTWVKLLEEKDVRVFADAVFAGTMRLSVPPGRSTSMGRCTLDRDATVFAVFPHMHQTGVAMKVAAHTAQHGDLVFYDGPYNFENQLAYPVDMVTVRKGDVVDISCTYENPTDTTLPWGESSKEEMCNAGLARFPAGGPNVCNR